MVQCHINVVLLLHAFALICGAATSHRPQDRGTAVVALWSRVIDREGLYDTWQELGVEEQRQVSCVHKGGKGHVNVHVCACMNGCARA